MEELNLKVISSHNPNLIDNKKSPNENIIYHLYSDGTITYQKGGDSYGRRSVFDLYPSIYFSNISYKNKFNFSLKSLESNESYSILTKEQCILFRKEMEEIMNNI
jgi:hypothetical protein